MAGAKENVVIEAGDCQITILPALGGKISSIRLREHELLQAPLRPYAARTKTLDFADGDASGWDECLPSVAGCTVSTEAGEAVIPDHGDLWRVPWKVLEATESTVTMRADCFSLPLQLTRSLIVSETASGWRVEALYSLANLGGYDVPWVWSAHPCLAVEAGDWIVLPEGVKSVRVEGSAGNRLGLGGGTVAWPHADPEIDLSMALGVESGVGDKVFAGPFSTAPAGKREAWCSLERRGIGVRLSLLFDPTATSYLGLWMCYGGWPDQDGPKQMCVAFEPTTAPVDSVAVPGVWSQKLGAGETRTWPLSLRIDALQPEAQRNT